MVQCNCVYKCSFEKHRNDGVTGLPAFVLAAPGRDEEVRQRPAAGDTGLALNHILMSLNRHCPELFPSICRYQYRITNAFTDALYVTDNSNKTRPTRADVDTIENKQRLLNELQGRPVIIALSPSASWVTEQLHEKGSAVVNVGVHPGLQTINGAVSPYKTYNGITLQSARAYVKGPLWKRIKPLVGSQARLKRLLSQMRYFNFVRREIIPVLPITFSSLHASKHPKPCDNCQKFHDRWRANWGEIDSILAFLKNIEEKNAPQVSTTLSTT